MLSAAKHLQYLSENKQMQILRFAQDDTQKDFFRSLLVSCPSGSWRKSVRMPAVCPSPEGAK